MTQRLLDLALGSLGLALLSPVMLAIAVLVRMADGAPVLYRQERMGRRFKPFAMYKFRTMKPQSGGVETASHEGGRVTRIGHVLRKTKLDELPQLVNVLKGEMSLVGPRPELRRYVERFREDYASILDVRPGITDTASIAYRDESTLLARYADPEDYYVRVVLPAKIRMAKEYVRSRSLGSDLRVLLSTVACLLLPGPSRRWPVADPTQRRRTEEEAVAS